ncbi:MAG: type II toxin-antitoxin system Phd/YefM family antitoxin [Rhodoferax sp.]
MSANTNYGLEQARIQLPSIVANAHAGVASIITRHGKPYAAVVPVQDLQRLRSGASAPSDLLALRGSGRGLWGADVGKTISRLRDEWDRT